MELKDKITQLIASAIAELGLPQPTEIELQHPAESSHGDYATNIALKMFGELAEKSSSQASSQSPSSSDTSSHYEQPRQLATAIADTISQKSPKPPFTVTVAGPGFINFSISEQLLLEELVSVITKSDQITKKSYQGKNVVVEFTDPNPFKQLHIGHLYSNTVGESISRLLTAAGAEVRRADYFGDVGLHVAKSIWGMREKFVHELEAGIEEALRDLSEHPLPDRVKFLGAAYAKGATAYEESEVAKQQIDQLNKLLYVITQELAAEAMRAENREWQPLVDYRRYLDSETAQNWDYQLVKQMYQLGKSWSLAYFESIYDRVGMSFDDYYPESVVAELGMQLVMDGLEQGVFERSDGAVVFPGDKFGLHTRVFVNSSGLPTYETKELGLAPAKHQDHPYDLSLIITGNEINEYFQVLIEAMRQLEPELGEKTKHLGHGMVRLPEGKMSSRTGEIITAEWLLNEAAERIWDQLAGNEKGFSDSERALIAERVGQAAIKYAFLSSSIGKDIAFSFDESLSFQGNSGPYLQYMHVRCQSVLKKAVESGVEVNEAGLIEAISDIAKQFDIENNSAKESLSLSAAETDLLRHITKYNEIVSKAVDELAPHHVCGYLHQLAQQFSVFYTNCPILTADSPNQQQLRLALTVATKKLLESGFELLNIQPVERM